MATPEKPFDAKSTTAISPNSSFSNNDIGLVEKRQGSVRGFVDSFRPSPDWNTVKPISCSGSTSTFDVENVNSGTASSPLSRRLKGRHLQMIAIGGSIGTGLFVSSGAALATGGPAALLIAFGLIGIMLFCTVQALGEMAVLFPVAGSFSAYSTRFLDPAWGFAMGCNYAMQWLVVLPLEVVAATIVLQFWTHGNIPNDAFVAVFYTVAVIINMFGVKGYGEAEFVFSIIKVVAVIGFIIMGIILVIAGGPDGGYLGGTYWQNPGAFNNGFKGTCSVFVTAAFSFAGTELVGLAAAETANPRKSIPTAVKQVFWRITLFYMVSLTLVGLLVPYTNKQLLAGDGADARASPFVIAITNAGINVLPSIMNAVILIAVLSVGNSSVYGSSRTLAALSDQRQAPKILGYIDRKGRPLVSIGVSAACGLLAFFAGSKYRETAFNWMIALSGLSSIFTWGSICLAHIRFRRAWAKAGHSLDELAFRSVAGVAGSWVGFIFNCLVLAAQFWTGFAPVGYGNMTVGERVESFFLAFLAAPVVVMFYLGYKLYYKPPFMRTDKMDLHTGMRELDGAALAAQEREEKRNWPKWKQVYRFFC